MKTIQAFAIRSTVAGVHYDAIYLDEPGKDVLDAKLAKEHELHGAQDANGEDRWVRAQPIALVVDEEKHPWAKDLPAFKSDEEKAAEERATREESEGDAGQANAAPPKVSGSGTVTPKK